MPLVESAVNLMLDALGADITHLSLHTANPATTGASEATGGSPAYARKAAVFTAANDGVLPLTTAVTFDVPAGTYSYVGAWASGVWRGYGALPVARVKTGQDTITVDQFEPTLTYEA
jgi:hypothetical protein